MNLPVIDNYLLSAFRRPGQNDDKKKIILFALLFLAYASVPPAFRKKGGLAAMSLSLLLARIAAKNTAGALLALATSRILRRQWREPVYSPS